MIPVFRRFLASAGIFLSSLLLSHCSSPSLVAMPDYQKIKLEKDRLHSFDGDKFPVTTWLPKDQKKEPELIIIGVHGISGAAADYKPLANHLLSHDPRVAIYAAETRGQGNDPVKERRGHIANRKDWFRDLTSFTALIRKKHPKAKVIWCGESMGSLIVLHTYAAMRQLPEKVSPTLMCDGLILASPIVDIRGDFPKWKEYLAKTVATLFPKARISLETLGGSKEVHVTKNTIHQEQAATNPYHVKRHTLRLLTTLGDMIRKAGKASQQVDVPLLILHGGKDIFSDPQDVTDFEQNIPVAQKYRTKRIFYPESFHLLFHDHQSDQVVTDIGKWLKSFQ